MDILRIYTDCKLIRYNIIQNCTQFDLLLFYYIICDHTWGVIAVIYIQIMNSWFSHNDDVTIIYIHVNIT